MLDIRIIPVLLYKNQGLYKSVNFKNHNYIGDPINAIKIFNDKEVDELIFLDIDASTKKTGVNYNLIEQITGECFMPLSYGGGISTLVEIEKILKLGVEKVVINSYAINNLNFIKEASDKFGSSTIVVSVDYKKDLFGRLRVYSKSGNEKSSLAPIQYCLLLEEYGVGEIMLNSIDHDGIMNGYDLQTIEEAVKKIGVPLIACGGAGTLEDFKKLYELTNVSAMAAGSMFVYHGPFKAVLINYPSAEDKKYIFKK